MTSPPTILYVDCRLDGGIERRRLAGMRRYAAARGWRVETLVLGTVTADTLKEALDRLRPVGCAVECWCPDTALQPAAFGNVPVVYFGRPNHRGWQNALCIECDDANVARMAFRELAAGKPPCFAVASDADGAPWAHHRILAFREYCREAGGDCLSAEFPSPDPTSEANLTARASAMVEWVAALPLHCAVFAVRDVCACGLAKAFAAVSRSLPRSATLVGVDGVWQSPFSRKFSEAISTVRLDFEMSGYLAAKTLSDLSAGFRPRSPGTALTFGALLVDRRVSTHGRGRRVDFVMKALDTIRRESCNGLTLAALVRRSGVSRSLFELRFKEAFGHTVHDEIERVRLDAAYSLLSETNYPIHVVADMCGFGSYVEASRVFRAHAKTTMSAWRAIHR